ETPPNEVNSHNLRRGLECVKGYTRDYDESLSGSSLPRRGNTLSRQGAEQQQCIRNDFYPMSLAVQGMWVAIRKCSVAGPTGGWGPTQIAGWGRVMGGACIGIWSIWFDADIAYLESRLRSEGSV